MFRCPEDGPQLETEISNMVKTEESSNIVNCFINNMVLLVSLNMIYTIYLSFDGLGQFYINRICANKKAQIGVCDKIISGFVSDQRQT